MVVERIFRKVLNRIVTKLGMQRRTTNVSFANIGEFAEKFLEYKHYTFEQSEILCKIKDVDEVWMNGEGNFILTRQVSLWRTLFIMHLANALDKRVRLVNSILSHATYKAKDPSVISAVEGALSFCSTIIYRDMQSLRLHRSLYPHLDANWCPDALFLWSPQTTELPLIEDLVFSPYLERIDLRLQALLRSGSAFVAISGASGFSQEPDVRIRARAESLIRFINEQGFEVVLIATDAKDIWLRELSPANKGYYVEPGAPLVSGTTVLSRATLLISGRYHPSIMAFNYGVPCIFMKSNSHKTRSLQEVMNLVDIAEYGFFDSEETLDHIKSDFVAKVSIDNLRDCRRELSKRSRENATIAQNTYRNIAGTLES